MRRRKRREEEQEEEEEGLYSQGSRNGKDDYIEKTCRKLSNLKSRN